MAREGEIIAHLTKEIETLTNAVMVFRSRVNFTIYIGPFIVLGSYIVARDGKLGTVGMTFDVWAAAGLLAFTFVLLGICSALIEGHSWDQCNRWRGLIVKLQSGDGLKPLDLEFKHHLLIYYIVVYLLMAAAFGSILYLLFSLGHDS